VFVSAGLRSMPAARFLALDFAAAIVWVPLLLALGGHLGEHLGNVGRVLDWVQGRVAWLIVLGAGIALVRHAWIAAERRRLGPSDAEP
jgi:membrane protein DedA with SNARE-associated domain